VEIVADAEGLEPALGVERPPGFEAAAEAAEAAVELDDGIGASDFESPDVDGGRRRRRGRRGRGDDRAPSPPNGDRVHARGPLPPPAAVPIDLNGLLAATRALTSTSSRPGFLGSGAFGGPWSSRVE